MLNDRDRFTVVGAANKMHSFNAYYTNEQSETTEYNKFFTATADNKRYFARFLDTLNKTKEITNHTLAFKYSFNLLERLLNSDGSTNEQTNTPPILMLYISRGLSAQMTDAKIVLETIFAGQIRLQKPIIINTCAIILGEFELNKQC